MDDARRLIRSARQIVSFSGAGLSAESSVATFRDAAKTALWKNFDPMQLATPEGFRADPELVIGWYNDRRRILGGALPNPAHRALSRRRDLAHITQNVDDLLERAGARDVIHLHGSINQDRCHAACGFMERIDLAAPPARRSCPLCGQPVRPDVVWFGELLPGDAWSRAEEACTGCDLLLVIGTSAVVYPAAGLISLARSSGASVIIVNTEASGASALADVELIGRAGELVPALLGE